MAYWLSVDVVLLLICLAFLPTTYGSSYQEFTVTNPKLCSPTGKKGKLKLTRYNEAAIVEETRSFDKWPGHVKFHCQFEVKDTQDNDRVVFAVIQNLKFREENGVCVDYVEFQSEHTHRRICGEMKPSLSSPLDIIADEVAPYAFIGTDEIDVTIHVASKKLSPDESLDLKIAFTSARKCWDSQGNIASRSSVPLTSAALQACGDHTYCISSLYANDSIVNCPFTDCRDEGGCPSPPAVPPYHRPSVGTKVTIGAITTVLASFLLFFACIWVLRHYRKFCWAGDYGSQREVRMTPVPPAPTGPDAMEAGSAMPVHSNDSVPTAPPLDSPESTILPDKDMPPSYDSLFPATSR